jgi:hypothetical protein
LVLQHAEKLARPLSASRKPTSEDLGQVFASTYYFFAAGDHKRAVSALRFLERHNSSLGIMGKELASIEANAEKISSAFSHFLKRPATGALMGVIRGEVEKPGAHMKVLEAPPEAWRKQDRMAHFAFEHSGSEVLSNNKILMENIRKHIYLPDLEMRGRGLAVKTNHYFRDALEESFEKSGMSKYDAERLVESYVLGEFKTALLRTPPQSPYVFMHALYLKSKSKPSDGA